MDATINSTGIEASVDYRKKRIKNVQKVELVRLMKANFLFIRGKHAVARSEKSRADVWKIITTRLNSLGPPIQSTEAWQRRWNDMRSATKSKMTKIQNYVRDHGDDCPYKLNLVERLIWDTFSVKPEEYMKDLNMKLWREKQRASCGGTIGLQQSVVDSISPSSSEHCFEMGWNQTGTTCHDTVLGGNSSMYSTSMSRDSSKQAYSNQTGEEFHEISSWNQQEQTHGTQPSSNMSYHEYPSTPTDQCISESYLEEREDASLHYTKTTSTPELVSGSKMLWELHKLFEVVLKQNEEILSLLRQSSNDN